MSASRLPDLLRQRLRAPDVPRFALGPHDLDTRLGGGMVAAGLHDLYAANPGDAGAAAAFALLLTMLAPIATRPVAWIRSHRSRRRCGALYAEGLVDLGFDPRGLLLVMPDDDVEVLRAADDIVRHGGAGAVVIELYGRATAYNLTASRRLAIAAARANVLALILRIDGSAVASAAETRWQIAAAPSQALAFAEPDTGAPGHPAFDLTLLRHRGGIAGFDTRLEWNREHRCFSPVPWAVPAVAFGGTSQGRRAA